MSEGPPPGDEIELGALLALLGGAAQSFRNVRATYRTWRHTERWGEAVRADREDRKRRGALGSFVIARPMVGSGERPPPPAPEIEATLRIWRDGERFREEHHGGRRDGNYGVADGAWWWSWSEQFGATSNQGDPDPSLNSSVGRDLQFMLDPTPLLSALSFRVTGHCQVAGRATVTAHATPDPRGHTFVLHELGTGAHHYQLEVDRERGVLLCVTALRDEQPFQKITTLAILFDEPIPAEIFQFVPPEGEEILPARNLHSYLQQDLTLTEAQHSAPFTVLLPEGGPAGWQLHCTFVKAAKRPPLPAQVSLRYHSDEGDQRVAIWQMAAADRAAHHFGDVSNDENWQAVIHDGTLVRVKPAEWGQTQACVERDGTFAYLIADNLTVDQLATFAASLRPAPSAEDSQGD